MPFPVQSLQSCAYQTGKPGDSVGMGAPGQRQYFACSCHSINICSVTTEVQSESVLKRVLLFCSISPPNEIHPFLSEGFPLFVTLIYVCKNC